MFVCTAFTSFKMFSTLLMYVITILLFVTSVCIEVIIFAHLSSAKA